MYAAGIDVGSISAKAVILSDEGMLGERMLFTGYNAGRAGKYVLFNRPYLNRLSKIS